MRIFNDEEYESVGACLVKEGSWVNVHQDHIIIGLKELQLEDCQSHRHLFDGSINSI
jgi:saccharopine dehydrogenase (NAD+, L-lysine-forming)